MLEVMISILFFCFKQKTAYEMRISDWSSDVCSSDLLARHFRDPQWPAELVGGLPAGDHAAEIFERAGDHQIGLARAEPHRFHRSEIGRASCRGRVCPYV